MTDEELIAATLAALHAACAEAGCPMSGDGRVSETTAAELLGVEAATLAKRRQCGNAPPAYRLPVGAGRVSYRLTDLAQWIEAQREDIYG